VRLPLPLHSYRLNSVAANSSRLVNCFAEAAPPEGRGPALLKRCPGISPFANCELGEGRGLHVMGGTLFAVCGTKLHSISAAGVVTDLGTISGDRRVWMADNGTQLVVGQEGIWYVWQNGTLSTITDPDFTTRGAVAAQFIDGYLVFVEPDSGRFFCSDLNNATVFDALDFATAEGAPDKLVTLAVDHRQLILFGRETTELWYNSGATGFPFERLPSGFIELGCAAVQGVTKLDNSVFWLANDRTIRRLSGQTPQRVSQHGIEERLRAMSRVDDCQAFSYSMNGHLCAVFRFPTAGDTFVFDATTNEWHERVSGSSSVWRVVDIADVDGKVFAQDETTGDVGVFDAAVFSEWGDVQRAEWTYAPLYSDGRRQFSNTLEIVCDTGVGLPSGQGEDPLLTLEVSTDGGRTWLAQPVKTLGAIGQYRQRVRWHRLGSARDVVFRCSISDPVPLTVWDTQIELVVGL